MLKFEFITEFALSRSRGGRIPPEGGNNMGECVRIDIEPVPKGRPRFHIQGRRVMTFTPSKTHIYEQTIALEYSQRRKKVFERNTPIDVSLVFGLPIPQTTPKKRRPDMESGATRHIKKPDVDNLVKAVLDALNGIAYEDDAQIVSIVASKKYASEPFVEIYIESQRGQAEA